LQPLSRQNDPIRGRITNIELTRPSYRYLAFVEVEADDGAHWRLPMTGTAEIRETRGPFSVEELRAYADKHLADTEMLEAYAQGRPLYVWVMERARRLDRPVPVRRRPGHQLWARPRAEDQQDTSDQDENAGTSTDTSLGKQR